MKATSRIAACLIGIGTLVIATASTADGPAPHGYLLNVWSGLTTDQTHGMLAFEGENAYERCKAAEAAMKAYHPRFDNKFTVCIPF
jgi:hypothetical protein